MRTQGVLAWLEGQGGGKWVDRVEAELSYFTPDQPEANNILATRHTEVSLVHCSAPLHPPPKFLGLRCAFFALPTQV